MRCRPDYFAHGPGMGFGRVGLGDPSIDPSGASSLSQLPSQLDTSTATAQVQAWQTQGQQYYATANQIAGAATGVVNGDLPSVTTATNLLANNFTPAMAQQIIQQASVVTQTSSGATETRQDPALLNRLVAAAGTIAAAIAIASPVLGAAVAAMTAIVKGVLSSGWAASGPITPTPGVVTALQSVPLPTDTSASPTTSPYPIANALAAAPAGCNAAPSISGVATSTVGGALAAWRDFLDMASNPGATQPSSQRQSNGYPTPGPTSPNGFTIGCSSWQDCADKQKTCLMSALSEAQAEAAIGLAIRWVPLGDPWVAPYQDTFSAMGSGANGTGYYLERQLVDLAFAYAAWPQHLADQQALAYLTALAYIASNYPGSSTIPGWISYKLKYLQTLVSARAPTPPAVAPAVAAQTTAAAGAGLAVALAAAPTVYALATRQPVRAVWGKLANRVGIARMPRLPRMPKL